MFFVFSDYMGSKDIYFWVTIHSDIYHLHADVGPQRPEAFPHHRQRGRGDDITGVDVDWMLQSIHTNFVRLTHRFPMCKSRTCLRLCSARWWVYHEHGCDYFDD